MEDPKKIMQEANGFLRTAERNMFSGKNQEAVELLNKADELLSSAKQQIPDDFQVKSLAQKIEKIRKDLERKGVVTRQGGNNELPFEVQAQLNRIRDHIVKKELAWAKKELDIYYSRFAGPMTDIPQIAEFKEHIQKLAVEASHAAAEKAKDAKANEQAAAESMELSRIWEEKFRSIPYFDGTPHNVQLLLEQREHFLKAQSIVGEYEKISFPGEKSITLESLANDVKQRISTFLSNFNDTANYLAEGIVESIEERIDFLNRDTAWQNDANQKPYTISKKEMDDFNTRLDEIMPLFIENSRGLESVTNAVKNLTDLNEVRMNERKKRTAMKPEAITGAEAETAINAATKALVKDNPDAKILKASVVKPWESKTVQEWADSTKTQWITKNTSETTVQIAALFYDNNCKLFTLHVEKVKQHDGSYSEPVSHILYEENAEVEKVKN